MHRHQDKRIIVLIGGSRSTKTWSIFQYLFIKAMAGERFTSTITRDKLTWIKSTLLKDLEEMSSLYLLPITPLVNVNRAEQAYRINGSELAFFGLDYAEKLHGRKQDYTWINEVIEVSKKHFDQLEMRTTKQILIDFNPVTDDHWVYDLEKRPDVIFIHSTQLDNPFLGKNERAKILSYEPNEINIRQGTADLYMWQVYGLGIKSRLQGVVFENWDIVDKVPDTANLIAYGLDFGYTIDPSCLASVWMQDNELYLDEIFYQTALTNQDIASKMISLGIPKSALIIADSAEPKSIEEIYRSGFTGIIPTTKGADSIKFGIDILKQFKIHITKRSINAEREFRRYKWREDKMGNKINEPVDEFNHFIDPVRYVGLVKLKKVQEVKLMPNIGF
jgi:phage terminase large subunit